MASQSLYRKWRSQTFGDLVGQQEIVRTLKNALNGGKLAHAYLFTGPRGTGKTTTARLLAKTINCENAVNGEPCNQCQQCREITAGNSFNVIEIDAASNRGIDSIRDLREKVMMPPATGKYKVYVLDEAHMLTTEAFNALLKTLEEPPDYAIFVMATTDVHKMLPTVLSRCQRFDFKRITTRQIVGHLNFVAEQEQVKLERSAAELIARAAAGGMRDALSLLDQAIAYSGEEISLAQVQVMLGVADPRTIQKLISHVANLASPAGLHLIHELSEAGADLRQVNIQIGEYWRSIMLAKAGADITTILDHTEDETHDILHMTQFFALEELTEFARIFAQNDLVQKNQGTPQLGLELAFLQCVELHRRAQSGQAPGTASTSTIQPRPNQTSARPAVSHVAPQTPTAKSTAQPLPTSPQPVTKGSEEILPDWDDLPTFDEREEEFEPSAVRPGIVVVETTAHHSETLQGEDGQLALTVQQVNDAWENVKKRVKHKNSQTSALLNYYTAIGIEGTPEDTVVVLQARSKVFYDHMNQGDRPKYIEWALSMEFRQKCRVRLVYADQHGAPSSGSASNSSSIHSAMPVALQQSAYREQSPAPPPLSSSAKESETKVVPQPMQEPPASVAQASNGDHLSSLARKNIVRENTSILSPQSSLEEIKERASHDPVVQEVIKTFTAKIVDIRPK